MRWQGVLCWGVLLLAAIAQASDFQGSFWGVQTSTKAGGRACWTSATLPSLAYSPTSKAFGGVTLGSYSTVTFTLSNSGGTTATSVSQSAITTPFRSYSSTCGSTLAAGANCTERVRFKPTQAKYSSATFAASYTGGSASATISGTGLAVGASDPFSGTDGDAINVNWAVNTAYGNHLLTNFKIYSNQLRSVASNSGGIYYSTSTSDISKVTVKGFSTTNTSIKKGVSIRNTSSALGYLCYLSKANTDSTWVRLIIGKTNGLSFIAQSTLLTFPVTSDYVVTASYSGGQVHCTATDGGSNSVTVTPATDATVAAGAPGIFIAGDATQADDFFDTWSDN